MSQAKKKAWIKQETFLWLIENTQTQDQILAQKNMPTSVL